MVLGGLIDNKPSLVQITDCRRKGDKPLSYFFNDLFYWRICASPDLIDLPTGEVFENEWDYSLLEAERRLYASVN